MILCDPGALVALLNCADPDHLRCGEVLKELPAVPMLTTVPCLVDWIRTFTSIAGRTGRR